VASGMKISGYAATTQGEPGIVYQRKVAQNMFILEIELLK
jgi:hypothetical protein